MQVAATEAENVDQTDEPQTDCTFFLFFFWMSLVQVSERYLVGTWRTGQLNIAGFIGDTEKLEEMISVWSWSHFGNTLKNAQIHTPRGCKRVRDAPGLWLMLCWSYQSRGKHKTQIPPTLLLLTQHRTTTTEAQRPKSEYWLYGCKMNPYIIVFVYNFSGALTQT